MQTGEFDESLWRPLDARRMLRTNPQWQLVSPDVPSLPLDSPQFSDLRYLAGFMIGENENNWSNAALVRALARIMNGRGTELRLIQRVAIRRSAPVEKPGVHFGGGRDARASGHARGRSRNGDGGAHDGEHVRRAGVRLLREDGHAGEPALRAAVAVPVRWA